MFISPYDHIIARICRDAAGKASSDGLVLFPAAKAKCGDLTPWRDEMFSKTVKMWRKIAYMTFGEVEMCRCNRFNYHN